jgi:hypothetical protein
MSKIIKNTKLFKLFSLDLLDQNGDILLSENLILELINSRPGPDFSFSPLASPLARLWLAFGWKNQLGRYI